MSAEILDIGADDYHANAQWKEPPLSKSIIHTLLTQSPRHAWAKHSSLNPDYKSDSDDGRFDRGTVAHQMFLEDDNKGVVVLDFDDWRTKAAKEAREYARSLGQIPMLQKHWDEVSELVEAIRDGAAGINATPRLFVGGKPEQTFVYREQGVLVKGRCDYLHDDYAAIDDLKTTAFSVSPERIARHVFDMNYDVQAALYIRGVEAATGVRPEFRFLFVETQPPYASAAYAMSPAALALADEKINFAVSVWKRCLDKDVWPAYPSRVMSIEPRTWDEERIYERQYREEGVAA